MAVLGAACGAQTVKTTADSNTASNSQPASSQSATSQPAPPAPAKVGSTITLKGNDSGEQMDVTLLSVVSPAHAGPYETPEAGKQYVGVQIKLTNSGTTAYSDSPSNGAALLDASDVGYQADIGVVEPDIGSPKIAPGASQIGFLSFQVPKGTRLAKFQFTLDSGFGPDTGEWTINKISKHGKRATGSGAGGSTPTAKVGSTITLTGNDPGERMAVTVLKVVDPAHGGEFDSPGPGKRFVGVEIRLKNVGRANYSDSPSNGAVILDTGNVGYQATLGAVEPDIGSPKIPPGQSQVGFLTFEIPKTKKIAVLQFTLDSGFGPDTGEWSLR